MHRIILLFCLTIVLVFGHNTPRKFLTNAPNKRSRSKRQVNEPTGIARDLSNSERQGLLDAHNFWRNRAANGELTNNKQAKSMPKLFWDKELEESSKEYGRLCIWGHSRPLGLGTLDYSYGENLYISTGTGFTDMRTPIDP